MKKVLTAPFLYVYKNRVTGKHGGTTNITRLSEETGLPYKKLYRIFSKESEDEYIDRYSEIWRIPIKNIKMGRDRGMGFHRKSMSFDKYI